MRLTRLQNIYFPINVTIVHSTFCRVIWYNINIHVIHTGLRKSTYLSESPAKHLPIGCDSSPTCGLIGSNPKSLTMILLCKEKSFFFRLVTKKCIQPWHTHHFSRILAEVWNKITIGYIGDLVTWPHLLPLWRNNVAKPHITCTASLVPSFLGPCSVWNLNVWPTTA